jgi:hypothetical protein
MICDPLSRIGGMSRKRFRLLADALQRKAPTFASSDAKVALFTQVVNDIAIACRAHGFLKSLRLKETFPLRLQRWVMTLHGTICART